MPTSDDTQAPSQRTPSQSSVVIHGIRDMLTSGELQPGSRLPVEKDLAARLAVSRSSLREGVRALATLGVLETRQGDGTYVTALDPKALLSPLGFLADLQLPAHAADLLAMRRVLESESVALAATNLTNAELDELDGILARAEEQLAAGPAVNTDEFVDAFIDADTAFHGLIARASGNQPLAATVDALMGRTHRARVWRALSEHGAVHETQREHRAILDELRNRDPERARVRMSSHLLGVEAFSAKHALDDPRADPTD